MPSKADVEGYFDAMVQSAFDFVERGISLFSDDEKTSLLLFATGLELFIKARLYHEHWSLVFANIDQAEFRQFATGELKTVGADKAQLRVRQIIGHKLPQSFETVRKHRNRIAHFTHGSTAEEREEIVSHQLSSWLDLFRLLTDEWEAVFNNYDTRANDLEKKMLGHREFLRTKFDVIKPDINNHAGNDTLVETCPACGFEAMEVRLLCGKIYAARCKVCTRRDYYITQPCMEETCGRTVTFFASVGPPENCPHCNESYASYLAEELDTNPIGNDDYFCRSQINCPFCHGHGTVVTHHDVYVCTECFSIDENVGYCGWCNEGQLGGVSEYSELSGCEFCDGRAG